MGIDFLIAPIKCLSYFQHEHGFNYSRFDSVEAPILLLNTDLYILNDHEECEHTFCYL